MGLMVENRAHFHIIGERDALEIQPVPQQVGEDVPGQRRRRFRIQRRVAHVRGHDRGQSPANRLPKGFQFHGLESRAVRLHHGQDVVRIRQGVAMPGKMFAARDDAIVFKPLRHGQTVRADRLGLRAIRPDPR